MITLDIEQGSDDWLEARRAIPTASSFDKILTASLKPSAQSSGYMGGLLAEYVTGETGESFSNEWTERGHELEPVARRMYQHMTGVPIHEIGLIYFDERKDRSCSPDGIANGGGLEIKCPKLDNHIGYVLDGGLPRKYALQVHGSMYVTGLQSWDFMSFHPEFRPLIITAERDEKIDSAICKELDRFCDKLADEKAKIDAMREF